MTTVNSKEELWIPASLIQNSSFTRAWSFRPRKIAAGSDTDGEGTDNNTAVKRLPEDNNDKPLAKTLNPCTPVKATAGQIARLSVQVDNEFGNSFYTVSWRKEGELRDIQQGDRHQFRQSCGFLYFEIARCRPSDSGVYHCQVQSENGFKASTSITLVVAGKVFFFFFVPLKFI